VEQEGFKKFQKKGFFFSQIIQSSLRKTKRKKISISGAFWKMGGAYFQYKKFPPTLNVGETFFGAIIPKNWGKLFFW